MVPHCAPSEDRKYRLFDCARCQDPEAGPEFVHEDTRRVWHCGWMSHEDWLEDRPDVPVAFGDEPYKEDVCPGYLMAQPLVSECIEAWRAFESGNWAAGYSDAPNVLWEGAQYFASVVEAYQAWVIRQQREKAERERQGHGR